MTMCKSADCHTSAVANVYWPGKPPMPMCQRCVSCAERVSSVIGAHLHTEALEGFAKIVISDMPHFTGSVGNERR